MIAWTIMICTLHERVLLFNYLVQKLKAQISSMCLEDSIELLRFCDNRELKTGAKRNMMVEKARGKYISFIDDDDDVAASYVSLLYNGIKENKDCLSLEGIITTNGNNPQRFIHSLKYKGYTQQNKVYYRPPNHLNVIKKELVKNFKFPEKNISEDFEWSMAICQAGVLKTEVEINEPLYYYKAVSRK